jgi:cyclic pyranopterin phosphate synthase
VNQTGVEMEALTAVSISALTLYDMTKSALKGTSDKIIITDVQLDSKSVNH